MPFFNARAKERYARGSPDHLVGSGARRLGFWDAAHSNPGIMASRGIIGVSDVPLVFLCID